MDCFILIYFFVINSQSLPFQYSPIQISSFQDKSEKGDECNSCKNDQEVVFIQDLGFNVKVAAPGVEPFEIQVARQIVDSVTAA